MGTLIMKSPDNRSFGEAFMNEKVLSMPTTHPGSLANGELRTLKRIFPISWGWSVNTLEPVTMLLVLLLRHGGLRQNRMNLAWRNTKSPSSYLPIRKNP